MTWKSSSERMREVPTSLLDETIVVDASTIGTLVTLTTVTIEKVGTGGVTIVMTSVVSDLVTTTTR